MVPKGVFQAGWGCFLTCPRVCWRKVIYFAAYVVVDPGETPLTKKQLLSEIEYREMRERFGDLFDAGMGAEAIKKLLEEIDLEELVRELREEIRSTSGQKKQRATRRLEVAEAFRKSGNRPEHIILECYSCNPA